MNPRVGAVYEASKRRVPTLEQRRNGIPFVSHGEPPREMVEWGWGRGPPLPGA